MPTRLIIGYLLLTVLITAAVLAIAWLVRLRLEEKRRQKSRQLRARARLDALSKPD